jgi:hypothetical protein
LSRYPQALPRPARTVASLFRDERDGRRAPACRTYTPVRGAALAGLSHPLTLFAKGFHLRLRDGLPGFFLCPDVQGPPVTSPAADRAPPRPWAAGDRPGPRHPDRGPAKRSHLEPGSSRHLDPDLGQGQPPRAFSILRSPSVHSRVIRLIPRTGFLCLPDQWRVTSPMCRARRLSRVESSMTSAPLAFDQRLGLVPELLGVGLQPRQQAVVGVVGGREGGVGLHARGLRTAGRARGGDEEVDVVLGGTAWRVHKGIIEHVYAPINCTLVN